MRQTSPYSAAILACAAVMFLTGCPPKPQPTPGSGGATVVVASNTGTLAEQLLACALDLVRQGMPPKKAAEQCLSISRKLPVASGISIPDILGQVRPDVGFAAAACSTSIADPRRAGEGGGSGKKGAEPPKSDPAKKDDSKKGADSQPPASSVFPPPADAADAKNQADKAAADAADALNVTLELTSDCNGGNAKACLAIDLSKTALNIEIARLHYYQDWYKQLTGTTLPAVGTQRLAPQAVSACTRAAEFIAECNRSQWRTPQCQLFQAKAKGCADPRIALTDGPQTNCELERIDPQEVKRVAFLVCSMRTRPGPDGSPCERLPFEGEIDRYRYGRGDVPGCGDPQALTTGEDCVGTFEVVRFGQPSLEEVLKEYGDKLGGPIVVFPLIPTPGPPVGPRPGPRPGPGK